MQDDRVVVRGSSHGHLPASRYDNTSTPAGGRLPTNATNRRIHPRQFASLEPERLADFEVFRRFLPAVAHDFILNGLPLVEGAQSRALDRGNVHEYVLAAALRLNEAITLGRVEPLHGTGSHRRLLALRFM